MIIHVQFGLLKRFSWEKLGVESRTEKERSKVELQPQHDPTGEAGRVNYTSDFGLTPRQGSWVFIFPPQFIIG